MAGCGRPGGDSGRVGRRMRSRRRWLPDEVVRDLTVHRARPWRRPTCGCVGEQVLPG